MIFSVKNNSSGIAIFPAVWEGHIFMETGVRLGLWPGLIWAGYRLNGSLKTGFTMNRFHSVSGYLENGPNRFETGQIFPKRAEKKPGFYPGKNGIFTSL